MILLHICSQSDWEAAQATGEYRADSLMTEGFIHCSTPEQALLPANRFYRGRQGLVLLVIDTERLRAEIRFEDVGEGQVFPHLYGPLNADAVVEVVSFPPETDGTFRLPEIRTNHPLR